MLKLDDLKNVERVIVHGKCPDGMASAIFLWDALGVEPEFLCHGTKEYTELEATSRMLFCDISPPSDRYQEFVNAGAIVLDHHKKSESIVKSFGDRGVFADEKLDPGVSGGTLAFYHVWLPLANEGLVSNSRFVSKSRVVKFKLMADLIGIADTWQKDSPFWDRSRYLTEALTFYSWEYWKNALMMNFDLSREMEMGRLIFEDRLELAAEQAEKIHLFEYGGFKVGIFNDLWHLTSDVAEVLRKQGINLVVGFNYYTNRGEDFLRLSLRSDGSLDVADLAEHIDVGGGGHTKAAGCSIPVGQIGNDPFLTIEEEFKDYIFIGRLNF